MKRTCTILAILAAAALAGCATKKGFEIPGQAFGCPVGEAKVGSMGELVALKTQMEGKRTTIVATEMRCTKSGDLLRIDANLNNDSSSVKRIAYKFQWIQADGMRAWDEEPWKPVMLYENSNLVINSLSPTNKAADFRLILRSQE